MIDSISGKIFKKEPTMLFIQNEWTWEWDPNSGFGFFANRNHMATIMVMGTLVGLGCLFVCSKKKY